MTNICSSSLSPGLGLKPVSRVAWAVKILWFLPFHSYQKAMPLTVPRLTYLGTFGMYCQSVCQQHGG